MLELDVVVAADQAGGIGRAGTLPWRLPGDMAHFRRLTVGAAADRAARPNAVLMGRKTWESLPARFRPLPERLNVVLSRRGQLMLPAGVLHADGLPSALALLEARAAQGSLGAVFVGGGAELYRQVLALGCCRRVHLTRIAARFECDRFLGALPEGFVLAWSSGPLADAGTSYRFERWERAVSRP